MDWKFGKFSVSASLKNTANTFLWRLIVVYIPAYEYGKQEFIDELHYVLEDWDGPTLIGGDFNLVRVYLTRTMEILIFIGLMPLIIGLTIGG